MAACQSEIHLPQIDLLDQWTRELSYLLVIGIVCIQIVLDKVVQIVYVDESRLAIARIIGSYLHKTIDSE
jgi:hypothetical protein